MTSNDSGPVAALRRELAEARRAAGDASEREAVACRERDDARSALSARWAMRREIEAALGMTPDQPAGDEAMREALTRITALRTERDGARDIIDALRRELAAAEATLRETTIALERVTALRDDALEEAEHFGERMVEARDALRSLLVGLSMDDAPRRAAIDAARALVATWDAPPVEAATTLTPEQVRGYLAEGHAVSADIESRMRGPETTARASLPVDGPGADLEMAGRGAR